MPHPLSMFIMRKQEQIAYANYNPFGLDKDQEFILIVFIWYLLNFS